MSTKIYNGIRIKRERLEDWIEFFRELCFRYLTDKTAEFMGDLKEEKIRQEAESMEGLRKEKSVDDFLKDWDEIIRCAIIFAGYMKQSKNGRAFFNADCWCNIFPNGDWFYIIPEYPYGCSGTEYPDWVEKFGYWNNTDEPEGVTEEEWNDRKEKWGIVTDRLNDLRLTHEVVNAGSSACIGILELSDRLGADTGHDFYAALIIAQNICRKWKEKGYNDLENE